MKYFILLALLPLSLFAQNLDILQVKYQQALITIIDRDTGNMAVYRYPLEEFLRNPKAEHIASYGEQLSYDKACRFYRGSFQIFNKDNYGLPKSKLFVE